MSGFGEALQRITLCSDEVTFYSVVQQASLLVASARSAEVSELTRKLQLTYEEVVRINKRFEETQCMRVLSIYLQLYMC